MPPQTENRVIDNKTHARLSTTNRPLGSAGTVDKAVGFFYPKQTHQTNAHEISA